MVHGPLLTCSLPVYEYIILNHTLSGYIQSTLQLHNSPVDCARELFASSNDSVSLLVCNEKNFSFGFTFFCG